MGAGSCAASTRDDPNNVAALIYAGWILAVSAERLGEDAAIANQLEQCQTFLDATIAMVLAGADPYFAGGSSTLCFDLISSADAASPADGYVDRSDRGGLR